MVRHTQLTFAKFMWALQRHRDENPDLRAGQALMNVLYEMDFYLYDRYLKTMPDVFYTTDERRVSEALVHLRELMETDHA